MCGENEDITFGLGPDHYHLACGGRWYKKEERERGYWYWLTIDICTLTQVTFIHKTIYILHTFYSYKQYIYGTHTLFIWGEYILHACQIVGSIHNCSHQVQHLYQCYNSTILIPCSATMCNCVFSCKTWTWMTNC